MASTVTLLQTVARSITSASKFGRKESVLPILSHYQPDRGQLCPVQKTVGGGSVLPVLFLSNIGRRSVISESKDGRRRSVLSYIFSLITDSQGCFLTKYGLDKGRFCQVLTITRTPSTKKKNKYRVPPRGELLHVLCYYHLYERVISPHQLGHLPW